MHFSLIFTAGLVSSLVAAAPAPALPGKTKPLPTPTDTPVRCSTDPGTSTVLVTSTETQYEVAETCGPDNDNTSIHQATLTRSTTSTNTKVIATPTPTDPCAPTETATRTTTETRTVTKHTPCATPEPCQATGWEVPYSQYEPYNASLPYDHWKTRGDLGIQQTIEEIGMSPASWNDYHPWMFSGFHVAPNAQVHNSKTTISGVSTENICVAPGRAYYLDLLVGAIEGKVPANAKVSVKLGSKYLIQDFPVCVGNYLCNSDGWNFHTTDGQRILTTEIGTGSIIADGDFSSDGQVGFTSPLEVTVSYPNDAPASDEGGVFVTHVWVRRNN